MSSSTADSPTARNPAAPLGPEAGLAVASAAARVRDLVELTKPRITLLVVMTAAVGLWVAPGSVSAWRSVAFLAATAALVAAANVLNCWLEVTSDARMKRTRDRALPAGRLEPSRALGLGIALAAGSLVALRVATDPLTTALGALAFFTYVCVYTPLKRVSWIALLVGAIPGALPPLMGWTAATGSLGTPGWILFGVLFFWQLPHFIMIALYLEDDYRRGGHEVLPLAKGRRPARFHAFAYTLALVVVSLAAFTAGMGGVAYLVTAVALGAGFVYLTAQGLGRRVGSAWARRTFFYTLVYLPVLLAVLVLDLP